MIKERIKLTTLLSSICILIFTTGCQKSDHLKLTKSQLIENTINFLELNEPESAIKLINSNEKKFEGDTDIIMLKAEAYMALNDPLTASVTLLSAYEKDNKNPELISATYFSLKTAGMDTGFLLIPLAEYSESSLDQSDWLDVSIQYELENNIPSALDALYRYIGTNEATNSAPHEIAYKIYQFNRELNNSDESIKWLNIIAGTSSKHALTAHLELISYELDNEQWSALNERIIEIESRFPNALEDNNYYNLRDSVTENLNKKNIISLDEFNNDNISASKSGNFQNIDDLEAFAKKIADTELQETEYNELIYDPSIEIEPADPIIINDSNILSPNIDNKVLNVATNKAITPIRALSVLEIESILEEANEAFLNNEYGTASSLYKEILDDYPNRAPIWNQLSKVYLANKQYIKAENAALEAIKNQASNIQYTLNYLNIARETKSNLAFLAELTRASQQFPNSPDITLSLAKEYEKNSRYRSEARSMYMKFISLAPNHPQRTEVENLIQRLP